MCQQCDDLFDHMSGHFEELMADHRENTTEGRVRDTPGQRVGDLAEDFEELVADNPDHLAYFLAIAIERLVALEVAGIPT